VSYFLVDALKTPEKLDTGKPQVDLLLNPGALEVAKALTYGAGKYGRYNYLSGDGLAYSRLAGAAARHLTAWLAREGRDEESGLSHLAHAGASIVMLADLEARCLGIDDRWPGVTP
jgi:hypothetical protein